MIEFVKLAWHIGMKITYLLNISIVSPTQQWDWREIILLNAPKNLPIFWLFLFNTDLDINGYVIFTCSTESFTSCTYNSCFVIDKRSTNTIQIKLGWALFVTYTIIQSIMRSEMCSLHLTHPSVHTWSSGQPTVQHPGSSHGLPFGAGIRTHNLELSRVSSPTLYPLGQRLPIYKSLL